YCLPVIAIDGTFLTSKYAGTLLVATSIDGAKKIFPLAFVIVESENTSSWNGLQLCCKNILTTDRGFVLFLIDRDNKRTEKHWWRLGLEMVFTPLR
ncbi:hypothetical protein LINPERPRIM_LOCUS7217, partial [Linum perenne]